MNRQTRRKQKRNKGIDRKRQRNADERKRLKRKTDWALQLCLGCTLMTMQDLDPDFKLSKHFFDRLNENIHQATDDSHNLDELCKVIKEEYGFDIRRI